MLKFEFCFKIFSKLLLIFFKSSLLETTRRFVEKTIKTMCHFTGVRAVVFTSKQHVVCQKMTCHFFYQTIANNTSYDMSFFAQNTKTTCHFLAIWQWLPNKNGIFFLAQKWQNDMSYDIIFNLSHGLFSTRRPISRLDSKITIRIPKWMVTNLELLEIQ